ncbi:PhnA domain-containing protein [Chryseolinea lacunae]|uniref:PhnA domain-containing protein n=1 Tax=Chryseolinea lacunae TaxID=2801331 RepID=A0ABS1KP41_9BACT|nr:alkylphosphonate utilization protein [Chryseolinea lacunae]MBL0740998.1 PhnA domain-containing protein [Chryseolinea lacunae]
MSLEQQLRERSEGVCELCAAGGELSVYAVTPASADADKNILVCATCAAQLTNAETLDANHWRCLNTSMWSTVPGVQVVAWRTLQSLRHLGWPQDLLDMLYLDDETLAWAKATEPTQADTPDEKVIHKDSNGTVLQTGDTVVLIKDLDVKGGGFTAKRGTAVRGITLVEDNATQIEGKVNGQQIVILTQYVKKSA